MPPPTQGRAAPWPNEAKWLSIRPLVWAFPSAGATDFVTDER